MKEGKKIEGGSEFQPTKRDEDGDDMGWKTYLHHRRLRESPIKGVADWTIE